jgi:hypothetical protein
MSFLAHHGLYWLIHDIELQKKTERNAIGREASRARLTLEDPDNHSN